MIFEGSVLIDLSLTTSVRNDKSLGLLDDKKKKVVEAVLNNEFCNIDVDPQASSCTLQNLEYKVKSRISCGILQKHHLVK